MENKIVKFRDNDCHGLVVLILLFFRKVQVLVDGLFTKIGLF